TRLGLVEQIQGLSRRESETVHAVLGGTDPLSPQLVPHVIPLLAVDEYARLALEALRRAAPTSSGQLVDHLLDRKLDMGVRQRIPRVLVASPSALVVQGLLSGLEDPSFLIRLQCGRALAHLRRKYPDLPLNEADETNVFERVEAEIAVGR